MNRIAKHAGVLLTVAFALAATAAPTRVRADQYITVTNSNDEGVWRTFTHNKLTVRVKLDNLGRNNIGRGRLDLVVVRDGGRRGGGLGNSESHATQLLLVYCLGEAGTFHDARPMVTSNRYNPSAADISYVCPERAGIVEASIMLADF